MLYSTYTKNENCFTKANKKLNKQQELLLREIRSKSRFNQLMEVLPDGWEKSFEINFYYDPSDIIQSFRESVMSQGSRKIGERIILSVIVSENHPATPTKYNEHLKRDYDYPIEEDKWKIDQDLTEFTPASFHLDHKLIWTMKERSISDIPNDSSRKISLKEIPFKYSINVYVPEPHILVSVENLKLNGVH